MKILLQILAILFAIAGLILQIISKIPEPIVQLSVIFLWASLACIGLHNIIKK